MKEALTPRPKFPTKAPRQDFQRYVRNAIASAGKTVEDQMDSATIIFLEDMQWEYLEGAYDNALQVHDRMSREVVEFSQELSDARLVNDELVMKITQGKIDHVSTYLVQWNIRIDLMRKILVLLEQDNDEAAPEKQAPKTEAAWLSAWKNGGTSVPVDFDDM